MENEEHLEIISEILEGTSLKETSFGIVYFKHLLQKDQRQILSQKQVLKNEAKKKGLLSEEETLQESIKEEMWSEEEELEIKNYNEKIKSLQSVIVQLNLPSKRKKAEKELTDYRNKLNAINTERNKILGLTIEKFVENKLQRLIMEKTLFYDVNFKKSVFENIYANEELKEVEAYKMQTYFFERFSEDTISKAILSQYFSLYLPFCEDVNGVFGKPLKDLTVYQSRLISLGRYFLSIFKNCSKKIPENIAKDPDLLISFYEGQRADSKGSRAQKGSGGSTHFGATKEDMAAIKKDNEDVVDLAEEMEKRGGSLNMKQMMELHGV